MLEKILQSFFYSSREKITRFILNDLCLLTWDYSWPLNNLKFRLYIFQQLFVNFDRAMNWFLGLRFWLDLDQINRLITLRKLKIFHEAWRVVHVNLELFVWVYLAFLIYPLLSDEFLDSRALICFDNWLDIFLFQKFPGVPNCMVNKFWKIPTLLHQDVLEKQLIVSVLIWQ